MNIVNIIKQIRFLQGAVNYLTTRAQRRWIYMQARYNVVGAIVRHSNEAIQVGGGEISQPLNLDHDKEKVLRKKTTMLKSPPPQ
jgi:hypothetical protein